MNIALGYRNHLAILLQALLQLNIVHHEPAKEIHDMNVIGPPFIAIYVSIQTRLRRVTLSRCVHSVTPCFELCRYRLRIYRPNKK